MTLRKLISQKQNYEANDIHEQVQNIKTKGARTCNGTFMLQHRKLIHISLERKLSIHISICLSICL